MFNRLTVVHAVSFFKRKQQHFSMSFQHLRPCSSFWVGGMKGSGGGGGLGGGGRGTKSLQIQNELLT